MNYQIIYGIDSCSLDAISFDTETVKAIYPQDNRNIVIHFKDGTKQEIQNVIQIILYRKI